jgi:hypothetical protein
VYCAFFWQFVHCSALGYESYIEGVVAVLVILVYLIIFKADRQRLDLYSIKGIANIAFEVNNNGGTAGSGEAGGGKTTVLSQDKVLQRSPNTASQAGHNSSQKTTESENGGKGDFGNGTACTGVGKLVPSLSSSTVEPPGALFGQEARENSRRTARLVSFANSDSCVAPVSAWQED